MPEMQVNENEAACLLKAVDLELSSRGQEGVRCGETGAEVEGERVAEGVTMTLEDVGLWRKFDEHTNEMIVTKSGRCPPIKTLQHSPQKATKYSVSFIHIF